MFRDIHYSEVAGLYDVTVTYYDNDDVGGVLLFGCAICMYFRLWVCNTVIGTVSVDGGYSEQGTGWCGESFEMIVSCDREEG